MSTISYPNSGATETKQDAQIFEHINHDSPVYGDAGPLQQHEKEQPDYPARELLTYDTNISNVFGTQRLLSDDHKKIKTEISHTQKWVDGISTKLNDYVTLDVTGMASASVQIFGSFSQYLNFEGSLNGQDWVAVLGTTPASPIPTSISYAIAGIWKLSVADLKWLRVRCSSWTSGVARIIIFAETGAGSTNITSGVGAYGSATLLAQGRQPYDLLVSDSVSKEAFYVIEPFVANQIYSVGDVVSFNGRVYRCIQQTSNTSSTAMSPANASYWLLDIRQPRSVVTNQYLSQPDAPRMRVEVDLDDYQTRLQEQQTIQQALQIQNDMINNDYALSISQDFGGNYGKRYSSGASGMSSYTFDEIR